MADYTPNLNLEKPLENESFRRQVLNDNMDKIDVKFGSGENEGHSHNGEAGQGTRISYNDLTDKPTLTPEGIGAETPAGAQAKADAAQAAAISAIPNYVDKGFNLDLARCYAENVKPIAMFQSNELWSSVNEVVEVDTTNVKIGLQSIKSKELNNTAGSCFAMINKTLDLTKFQDGSVSSTDEYITAVFYVSDISKVTGGVIIAFKTASSGTYEITFTPDQLVTGWNYKYIRKADIPISQPTPDWSAIATVWVGWYSTSNAQNAYVSFQYIGMVRKDPQADYPNPFQHKDNGAYVRDFAINSGFWFVGQEFGEIICKDLMTVNGAFTIRGNKPYIDCIATLKSRIPATSVGSNRIGLIINESNYIQVYAYASNFTVAYAVGGEHVIISKAITTLANDVFDFSLRRKGSSVTISCVRNGDMSTIQETSFEFATTESGVLGLGAINTILSVIKAASITTLEHADHASRADWAANVGGGTWEVLKDIQLAAHASQVDITNIPKCKAYKFIFPRLVASSSTVRDLIIQLNGITTNYGGQWIKGNGTTVSAGTAAMNGIQLPQALMVWGGYSATAELLIEGVQPTDGYWSWLYSIINYQSIFYTGGGVAQGASMGDSINKFTLIPSGDQIGQYSKIILMGLR